MTDLMKGGMLVALIALVVLAIIAYWFGFSFGKRFTGKRLMTKNEEEFFRRIVTALPGFYVFPQVAIRAFVAPTATQGSRAHTKQLAAIGSKHCDFLICNSALDAIAIIELDDRSHNAELDALRDAMTASAGIQTLRYQSRNRPSPADIQRDIGRIAQETPKRLD